VLQGGGVAANKLYQVLMQKRLGTTRYRALAAKPCLSRMLALGWPSTRKG
jgi:hypothetical protein